MMTPAPPDVSKPVIFGLQVFLFQKVKMTVLKSFPKREKHGNLTFLRNKYFLLYDRWIFLFILSDNLFFIYQIVIHLI